MKNVLIISAIVLGLALFFAFRPSGTHGGTEPDKVTGDKVEVIYFHFSRRCVTCLAVESKTREALIALYPEEFRTGKITFASINLEEDKNKEIIDRAKVTGQALLVISGNVRKDLTADAFLYANNDFDKLKAAIRKVVDPLIKQVN
jgi:hypothetical protein